MDRRWELDALRGLMLVLMTVTHLPILWSGAFGQPLGFVSAAEGFVFLSAFMAGQAYTRKQQRSGDARMRSAFLRRAWKIYLCQAALLGFAFSVVAALGALRAQPAVTDLLSFYFERPLAAFAAGLALIYNPPLLDILPMYIVLMLVSPVLLLHGPRGGWPLVVPASLLLWVGAQWDLGAKLYEAFAGATGLAVPVGETGAFHLAAWQFLWVFGLWMGAEDARGAPAPLFPAWLVAAAWAWAVTCLVWRHAIGQAPFGADATLNLLFDKWRLGPLRLIDFMALLVVLMHHADWLKTRAPRIALLEAFGRAALPVFCAHLVATLLALAVVGEATPQRRLVVDLAVVLASFGLMAAVAWVTAVVERRPQRDAGTGDAATGDAAGGARCAAITERHNA